MNTNLLVTTALFGLSGLILVLVFYFNWKFKLNKNKLQNINGVYFDTKKGKGGLRIFLIAFIIVLIACVLIHISNYKYPEKNLLFFSVEAFLLSFILLIYNGFSNKQTIYLVDEKGIHLVKRNKYIHLQKSEITNVEILNSKAAEDLICLSRYGVTSGSVLLVGVKRDFHNPLSWYLSIPAVEKRTKSGVTIIRILLGTEVIALTTSDGKKYLLSPIENEKLKQTLIL